MSYTVRRNHVPVAKFREVFEQMEPSIRYGPWGETGHACKDAANLIAERLGWYDRGNADGPRVRRALGLSAYPIGGPARDPRRRKVREWVTYDTAVRLCEAMDLDPVDLDL